MELVTLQLLWRKAKDQRTSLVNMSSSKLRGFEFYRERQGEGERERITAIEKWEIIFPPRT